MHWTYLTIRALHVLTAAFWLGAAAYGAWWVMPAIEESGPSGGAVMQALQRRGVIVLFPIVAGITVLTGIWLYWHYTAGFTPEISRSHAGIAFSVGGATGVLAFLLGAVVGASSGRANRTAAKAATASAAERADLLATVAKLRRRATTANRAAAALLIVTILLMAVALYV